MTIQYGLLDTGFVIKPLPVIREELNAAARLAFGESIDTSDRSVLGVLLGIIAERLFEQWQLTETIAASQDPDRATGTLLRALCLTTGTQAPAAEPSSVTLTLTGVAGTVIAAESRSRTSSTKKEFVHQDVATLVTVDAWAGTTGYAVDDRVVNGGSVYQCIQAGTSAGSGGPTGITPDATLDGGCLWTFLGIGAAAADVEALSDEDGAIVGAAKDIIEIVTPVTGWQSVTNVVAADVGRLDITDPALRSLREAELATPGSSTFDALVAELLDVPSVDTVKLFANNTDATDADGVPPHAIEALVQGGVDQDIWDTIFAGISAGIGMIGTEVGTVTDSQGTAHTIKFSRPTAVPIYIRVYVTFDDANYPTDGDDEVEAAIVTYGGTVPTGRDAVARVIGAQALTVPGVIDVPQCLVYTDVIGVPVAWAGTTGYVATPGSRSVVTNGGRTYICITSGTSAGTGGPSTTGTDITDGSAHWRYLEASVTITTRRLATYATSRITVVSTAGDP